MATKGCFEEVTVGRPRVQAPETSLMAEDVPSQRKIREFERQLRSVQLELDKYKNATTRTTRYRNQQKQLQELHEKVESMTRELTDIEVLNQVLTVKQRQSSDELNEARRQLIKVWKDNLDKGLSVLGIKRVGELDMQPFKIACYQKFHSAHVAQQKALQYCSLWQSKLADPSWHPLKIIALDGGETEEIIDEEDAQLAELKRDLGNEAYNAVCEALMEMNEFNPSGRYVVEELWNFRDNRKATLKEAVTVLLNMLPK